MANRTDPSALSVHGTNPQNLLPKIVRSKIYETTYWKRHCFGLSAASLVDKALALDHLGGTFGGNSKPTPFLCLTLKMLQIQPDKNIIAHFLRNQDHKYLRILGAFYLRLVGKPTDVYQYLEPLYNDYRKLRQKMADGSYRLTHVDEFIEELLHSNESCNIALPHLPKRWALEWAGALEPRQSALDDEVEEEDDQIEEIDINSVSSTAIDATEDPYRHHHELSYYVREREEGAGERVQGRHQHDHRRRDSVRKRRRRSRSPSSHKKTSRRCVSPFVDRRQRYCIR